MNKSIAAVLVLTCCITLLLLIQSLITKRDSVYWLNKLLISNSPKPSKQGTNAIHHDEPISIRQSDNKLTQPMQSRSAKDIQITIAIISNNRLESLQRLLRSLSALVNPSNIQINIKFLLEANSNSKLIESVTNYQWKHGHKTVNKRIEQGGLIKSVSEAWFPASDNEYGLLLEDDLEISPYAIIWIEKILLKVLSAPTITKSARIIGISLFQPTVTEVNKNDLTRRKPFLVRKMTTELAGDRDIPFLFQTPCSWGALYFPTAWSSFLTYLQRRLKANNEVSIPNSYTNTWRVSWKKYLFEFMYFKGFFLVYPNFRGGFSLSTNHMETGEHVNEKMNKSLSQREYYTVPLLTDEKSLRALDDMALNDFPCIDLFGYPYLEGVQLQRAISGYTDTVSPQEQMLIRSLNISLYQQQRYTQQRTKYSENYYRKSNCNSYLDWYVTGRDLFDSASITVMISSMHRHAILWRQIEYYASSRLVSTIIVTCHNFNYPVPRNAVIGHTLVVFVRPESNSLNNRFMMDQRITTASVLIVDDDIKIHIDDIEVLHEVWLKYPKYIIGTFPRWFGVSASNKLLYTQFEYNPKLATGVEYGLMLTKVMLIQTTYLFEYTCGNEDEISRDDHAAMLNTVSSLTNCEDIFMNGIIAANIFHAKESAVLAVRSRGYVGDYGIAGGLHGKNAKSWNEIRSDCLNYMHDVVLKYNKRKLPLQTKLIVPSVDREGNVDLVVTSNDTFRKRSAVNCNAGDSDSDSSYYCSWKTSTSSVAPAFRWRDYT